MEFGIFFLCVWASLCAVVSLHARTHTHTHTHLWSGAWSHMLTSVTCTSCAQRCPTLRTLPYNAVHAATDHLDQRIGDPKVRTAQHHGAEDCWWRRREHACAVLCHWLNHFALCFISCCFVCVWCVCVCVCVCVCACVCSVARFQIRVKWRLRIAPIRACGRAHRLLWKPGLSSLTPPPPPPHAPFRYVHTQHSDSALFISRKFRMSRPLSLSLSLSPPPPPSLSLSLSLFVFSFCLSHSLMLFFPSRSRSTCLYG